MQGPSAPLDMTLAEMLESERPRIVRLCAHITRNSDAAEDLAQETLTVAWLSYGNLRDPDARLAWINGIARNVCRRWARRRRQEPSSFAAWDYSNQGASSDPTDAQNESFDLEMQLERHELATLLDRALELLPPVTRSALIQQFVEQRPQAEIAERLALSRGAVAMRIQRGKLLLREALLEHFPEDAKSYGLLTHDRLWVATPLWCSTCGKLRLLGSLDPVRRQLLFRCPECYPELGITEAQFGVHHPIPNSLDTADGYRTAYEQLIEFGGSYLRRALERDRVECLRCGAQSSVRRSLPDNVRTRPRENYGVHVRCAACDFTSYASLSGLLFSTPAGRRFRHEHRRMCTLPEQEIEVDGRPAILTRFESVSSSHALIGITDAETLIPLQFHRTAR